MTEDVEREAVPYHNGWAFASSGSVNAQLTEFHFMHGQKDGILLRYDRLLQKQYIPLRMHGRHLREHIVNRLLTTAI